MNPEQTDIPQRPLSVRIGRIVVRLVLFGLILWGIFTAFKAYHRHKLAQEIAPIHSYARDVLMTLKKRDYFRAQGYLPPQTQRRVSIDWLAHFAANAELNATTGLTWGDWNRSEGAVTRYHVNGTLRYRTGRKNLALWVIDRNGTALGLVQFRLGHRVLVPTSRSVFP